MDFSLPSYSKIADPTASIENVPELTTVEVKGQVRAPKKKKSSDEKPGVSLSTVLPSLDKKPMSKQKIQTEPVATVKEEKEAKAKKIKEVTDVKKESESKKVEKVEAEVEENGVQEKKWMKNAEVVDFSMPKYEDNTAKAKEKGFFSI